MVPGTGCGGDIPIEKIEGYNKEISLVIMVYLLTKCKFIS